MNAKEAVKIATGYFVDLVGVDLSVEEVWYDEPNKTWCITLGRSRMLREQGAAFGSREIIEYKIVRISDTDGKPISLRDRQSAA